MRRLAAMASAEALNGTGRWLFGLLGRLSLELAILALVVAAVVWALRLRSPVLRHAFWGLVLAKPLVTLLVASPLSLYWFLYQASPPATFPTMPATRTLMPFAPMGPLEMGRLVPPPASLPSASSLSLPVRAVPLNGYGWLFLGWSATVAALAVRLAAGGAYVRYLTGRAEKAHQGLMAELAGRAAAAMGLRRPVPVFVCGDGCGPLLAGLVRPRVLLPRSLAAELPANRLELVLAHELAHARRCDNLILAAQRVVETLLFFHPAVWCCGRLMTREAEAACDERVVAAYGDTSRYADSLTRVAELRCGPMHRLLASTFAATESHCARRVRRILQGTRRRMTLGLTLGSAVCLVGLALTGLPSAGGVKGGDIAAGKAALSREAVEEAWAEVKGLLAAGNPVVVFGGSPTPDQKAGPSVVVGYDEGHGLIYFVPHAAWEPAPRWNDADPECVAGIKEYGYRARKRPDETNWIGSGFAPGQGMGGAAICFFAFKDRARTPSEQKVAVAVLRRAIASGRGEGRDEARPERQGGLEAFDLLASTLDQDTEIVRRDPDWWFAMEGLAWPPYRKTAAAFISRCATDFGSFSPVQKAHLRSAARSYEQSAAQFDELWKLFRSVGPLDEYDDRVKTVSQALSSRQFRTTAAGVVRRIRAAEESGIAEIESALAASPGRESPSQ